MGVEVENPDGETSSAVPRASPDLLPSLGRLVRGLSALFWGLPVALVICVQTANTDWLGPVGLVAPLLPTGLLLVALLLLGTFQPQERVWRGALERAKTLALINVGLSPFLYWWCRLPWQPFYTAMANLLLVTGLLFLLAVNPMLVRLTAMLPDETLRAETRLFTSINRGFLIAGITLLLGYFSLSYITRVPQLTMRVPQIVVDFLAIWGRFGEAILLLLVLPAIAISMALIWRTKEVILASVFGQEP